MKRFNCFVAGLLAVCVLSAPVMAARDVILVLDNSGSMRRHDPDFLTRVAVTEFVNGLAATGAGAGLVVFDDTARFVQRLLPLTEENRAALLSSLSQVDYSGQRTDSPAAMERAIYELKTKGRKAADKFIVFLTDGIVDTGDTRKDLDKSQWLTEDLAMDAKSEGIRIFGIAFTEEADFQLIQSLAARTHGEYYRAFTSSEIETVFTDVMAALDSPPEQPQPVVETVVREIIIQTPMPAPIPALREVVPPPLPELQPLPEMEPLVVEQPPGSLEELLADSTSSGPVAVAPKLTAPITPAAPRWLWLAVAVVAGLVIVAFLAALVLLRRNSRVEPEAGDSEMPSADIPQAFLNDQAMVTGEVSIELGGLPVMIGRIKGAHPHQFKYLVIDDNAVGRQHAIIEYRNHAFWVDDQGSVNGTYLNKAKVEAQRRLKHGDRLRFHKYEFEFILPEMFGTGMTLFSKARLPQVPKPAGEDQTVVPGEDQTVVPGDQSTVPPAARAGSG